MSVQQLLASHTSQQLSEWEAFDRLYGFGEERLFEVLADLHYEVQLTNHLLGAAHFTEEDGENPIPEPKRYPRGGEQVQPDDEE
jgi:hypothetical protein